MLQTVNNHTMLTDRTYSVGKKLVQVWIPAVSTLYFTLGAIWGLPAVEQVIGTLAALATFLGVALGLSSRQYDASGAEFDGDLVVDDQSKPGKTILSLDLNSELDPDEIKKQKTYKLKVVEKKDVHVELPPIKDD